MDSVHFEHSPNQEYPAIKLERANCTEHFSDDYISGKVEVEDGVQTNQKIINCKIEDSMDLGDISSVSLGELEREKKVRKFYIEFMFHHERLCSITTIIINHI